jgi:hypothetical protein
VAARCHEEEEEAKQPGRGGSIGFCSSAQLVEEREREREGGGHGRAQGGGRRGGGRRLLGEAVARARQDSKARLERRARSGVTRGEGKQEVDGGGDGRAAARGGSSAPAAEAGSRGAEGVQRKKGEGKGPKDLCAKLKDLRGLTVKQKFPLI